MPPPATRIGPAATIAWPAAVTALATAAALASHVTLAMGHVDGALAFAALQAVAGASAVGLVLRRRRPGPAPLLTSALIAAGLLAALAVGARSTPATGLAAMSGVAHALLYGALLFVFACTLRPGQTALVTLVASHVNPGFHAGMVPYTRAVTWAWAGFAAAQLVGSGVLLGTDPPLWRLLVTAGHVPLVVAMALLELAIRHWRWRHEAPTGLLETIRGTRRLMVQRAAKRPTTS